MKSRNIAVVALIAIVLAIVLVIVSFTLLAPAASTTTSSSSTTSSSVSTTQPSTIQVSSQFSTGGALSGVYTELQQGEKLISTGYTPVTFNVIAGQSYTITVNNFESDYFNHWSNGYTLRTITVEANGSSGSMSAIFTTTPQSPPSTPYSISVDSSALNGTSLSGFGVDISVNGNLVANGTTPVTFPDLEPGVQFQVIASSAGNSYFREFSNGDLNNFVLVTLNSTGTKTAAYSALYQYVPPSQAASLDIEAELANGTQVQGIYVTVRPTGSVTPFTGAFTGSSTLPFILLNNETYTVTTTIAFGNYHFAHWKDNSNTDSTRALTLDGNMTLIAVYTYTASS